MRIYPIVCLCGVITRPYLSLFILQLCSTIVCLFPKFFSDIRFRMKGARLLLVILKSYTVSPSDFLVSLTWVFCVGLKRKVYNGSEE